MAVVGRQLAACHIKGWGQSLVLNKYTFLLANFIYMKKKRKVGMVIYFCKFSLWETDRQVKSSKPSWVTQQDLISKGKQPLQKSRVVMVGMQRIVTR